MEFELRSDGSPTTSRSLIVGMTLFPIILILFSCFTIVDSGHVGVVRRLGAVQAESLEEGFHFKRPFMDAVEEIDIRLIYFSASALSSSKDLQNVEAQVNVQYSINGSLAPQVFQRVGRRTTVAATVIEPAIQESVKAITAQYTAEQLVTQRSQVKLLIQEQIKDYISVTLAEKELENSITIANVAITNFSFSSEFDRAIELKVKAEQEALQAKNEKIKRVTQAEAAAAERRLAAEASAFEIETSSKARAEAIEREAKALKSNPELIQLRAIETWDGKLPAVNSGSQTIPFLNLDKVMK